MLLNKDHLDLILITSQNIDAMNFSRFLENFLNDQAEKELEFGGVTKLYFVAPYFSYSVIQKWLKERHPKLIPLKSLLKERIRGIILDIIGSIELPIDDPAGSLIIKEKKILSRLQPLNGFREGEIWEKDSNFIISLKKGTDITNKSVPYIRYDKFVYSLMGVKYRIEDI